MRISIILGHPKPGSFNHAIADTARDQLLTDGHRVDYHDLYQEHFDPALSADEILSSDSVPEPIRGLCKEASEADGFIIVHPNWWGQPPAILKGWVDRVLRSGLAYRFLEGDNGEGIPQGLLRANCAIVFNTSNTPPKREQEVFGDPLESLWKRCIFPFCGVGVVDRRMFGMIVTSSYEDRLRWLDEALKMVKTRFPS